MPTIGRSEFNAGLFVLVAIILLAFGIFLLGQESQIFSSQAEFTTSFRDVQGLVEGAPVRLGGIKVGRVARIGFSEDPSDTDVHVTFLVSYDYLDRVRTDSEVAIQTQGLLGDKFLSLDVGKAPDQLPPGSLIAGRSSGDLEQIFEKAGTVVDTTVEIAEGVNEFLDGLNKDSFKDFSTFASNISDITTEVKDGKGFAHRLIYSDTEGKDLLKNLDKSAKNLQEITTKVKTGKGFLHALVYDNSGTETVQALTDAATNLGDTAAHISEIAAEIKTGQGLLHDLVYAKSPEGMDDIMQKLNTTAENLEKASEALAKGSGTIGALLVDSALYDNLVEVTDGAKRSFLLRQAIRSALDK